MAKKGVISEFFDLQKAQQEQQSVIKLLEDYISQVQKANSVFGNLKGAQGTAENIKNLQALAKAQKDNAAASKLAADASLREAKAREANAKAAERESKASESNSKAKDREAKSREASAKAAERAAAAQAKEEERLRRALSDYALLSKALKDAEDNYKQLYFTKGKDDAVTKAALETAKSYRKILDEVDQSLGNYQRNVGNYASGNQQLANSFQQIARELPSLAVSANTFFLAISNNLPIFFDAIQNTKKQIAELQAQGQQTPTLFQQLRSAVFSFNTALTLGVTFLTLFGGKIVDLIASLFKGKDANEAFRKSLEELNSSAEGTISAIKNINHEIDYLAQRRRLQIQIDLFDKDGLAELKNASFDLEDLKNKEKAFADESVRATNSRKKATDLLLTTLSTEDKAILQRLNVYNEFNGKATQFQNIAGKFLGLSSEQLKELSENTKQAISALKNVSDAESEIQNNRAKNNLDIEQQELRLQLQRKQYSKEQQEDADEALKKAKEIAEKNRKAQFEIDKLRLQDEIDLQKAIAGAQLEYISPDAKNKQLEAEKRLIELEKQFELGTEKLTQKERELIIENSLRKIRTVEAQAVVDIIAIRKQINAGVKEDADRQLSEFEAQRDKRASDQLKAIEGEVNRARRTADERIKAINDSYSKDLINKEDYDAQKEEQENIFLRKSLQSQIQYYKFLFDLYATDQKQREEALNKIADLEAKLSAIGINASKKASTAAKDTKDVIGKIGEAYKQLGQELQGLVFDLFTAGIQRQKNQIQEQIDLIDEAKKKSIDAENARTQSAVDRAANIATIEATSNAQREQLQKKQRQLDVEKAKFDRANAIVSITQQAAVSVVAALKYPPPYGQILAGIIAATAALQIARVIAQPIPKYKEGTANHPGGLAEVGHGKRELVITPDGRYLITQSTPHTLDLPKGTIVKPDADLALRDLHSRNLSVERNVKTNTFYNLRGVESRLDTLTKTIKDKREVHLTTPDAVKPWLKSGNSWLNHIRG